MVLELENEVKGMVLRYNELREDYIRNTNNEALEGYLDGLREAIMMLKQFSSHDIKKERGKFFSYDGVVL